MQQHLALEAQIGLELDAVDEHGGRHGIDRPEHAAVADARRRQTRRGERKGLRDEAAARDLPARPERHVEPAAELRLAALRGHRARLTDLGAEHREGRVEARRRCGSGTSRRPVYRARRRRPARARRRACETRRVRCRSEARARNLRRARGRRGDKSSARSSRRSDATRCRRTAWAAAGDRSDRLPRPALPNDRRSDPSCSRTSRNA